MQHVKKVAGIVLAAGVSSRMGRSKLSLPFRGQTILECVVDSALNSPLHQVIVVLGHQGDLLHPLLTSKDVTVVHNPHYESGQSSSIQAGLNVVSSDVDAALFLLGDQPLITSEIITNLITAYTQNPNLIVLPMFQGKRGNPVLFDRQTFHRFAELTKDTGARVLFAEYSDRTLKVPLLDPSILFDIDTEQDYQILRKIEQEKSPAL